MQPTISIAGPIVAALILGVGVPLLGMRMLVPSLEASPAAQRTNYRGATVFLGLGVVWLLWAGGAMLASLALAGGDAGPSAAGILILAGPLALVCFSLGLVDDSLGSPHERGFGGHLRALAHGRLTTGMLKLLGISAASFVAAFIVSGFAPWGGATAIGGTWGRVVLSLVAGASIALTSNLLNLLDLRPARAVKVYVVLGVLGAVLAGLMGERTLELLAQAPSGGRPLIAVVVLVLFVLGPAIAVWPYDAQGRGMFGDAGANPAGAVIGLLWVAGLPMWGLMLYFMVVLALNVASERVSFTRVIEGSIVLSRADALGRARERQGSGTNK